MNEVFDKWKMTKIIVIQPNLFDGKIETVWVPEWKWNAENLISMFYFKIRTDKNGKQSQ